MLSCRDYIAHLQEGSAYLYGIARIDREFLVDMRTRDTASERNIRTWMKRAAERAYEARELLGLVESDYDWESK